MAGQYCYLCLYVCGAVGKRIFGSASMGKERKKEPCDVKLKGRATFSMLLLLGILVSARKAACVNLVLGSFLVGDCSNLEEDKYKLVSSTER